MYPEIRRASARPWSDLGFPGSAIGGLSVGEPHEQMYEMVSVTTAELPANLLEALARGVDMFDCVMLTRNGRNGQLFTTQGIINVKNAQWTDAHTPIDPGSRRRTCVLLKSREYLGLQITSQQNLAFSCWLMREARAAIREDRFGT